MLLVSIFVNSHKEYYRQVKNKKIMNAINEELKVDISDGEYDNSYEC